MFRRLAAAFSSSQEERMEQTCDLPSLQERKDGGSSLTMTTVDLEAQSDRTARYEESRHTWKFNFPFSSFKPSPRMMSDFTLGMTDGMTVPFALTAGLSFVGSTKIVILGGVAELIGGAISMAIGGLLGARGEAKSYNARVLETQQVIEEGQALPTVQRIFGAYPSVPFLAISELVHGLQSSSGGLVRFIMLNQHQLAEPEASRAWICGLTVGTGYLFGGLLPLIPYFCVDQNQVRLGFYISVAVMVVALFAFGYMKTGVDQGWRGSKNVKAAFFEALAMLAVGGIAVGFVVMVILGLNHKL